ncbi:MAG: sensor histidine kinase [Sphingomonadales bacterium]
MQSRETYLIATVIIQGIILMTLMLLYERRRKRSRADIKNQVLLAEERSLQKIATELHDNIAPSLLLARLQLEQAMKEEEEEKENSTLQQSIDSIDNTLIQIRRLAALLHPSTLSQMGLLEATKHLLGQLRQYRNIKTTLMVEVDLPILEQDKQICLFRIIQESIQNLLKHASATEVNIRFTTDERFVYIHIQDNGIGFDIDRVQKGSGLYNLQHRAQSLQGQCTLLSRPGHGTHIHLQIPK